MLATAAVVTVPPAGTPVWLRGLATLLLLVVLGATWLLAVPEHRALSDGFDSLTHQRLLRADTVRLVAALADVAVAVYLLLA